MSSNSSEVAAARQLERQAFAGFRAVWVKAVKAKVGGHRILEGSNWAVSCSGCTSVLMLAAPL